MKNYIPKWRKLPRSIKKEYEKGSTIFDLSVKYKTDTASMRTALHAFGAKMRPPGGRRPGKAGKQRKITDDDLLLIMRWDDENVSHSEIARRISDRIHKPFSRERVRQLCLQEGHAKRRDRIIPKIEQLRAQRLVRQQARYDRIRSISDAWKSGASIEELSMAMFGEKVSENRSISKISMFRKTYGVELFPYRRPIHWSRGNMRQRVKRIREMSRVWNETGDYHVIQRQFHYKTYNSAVAGVKRYRDMFPHMFPHKDEILRRKLSQ